MQRPSFEVKSNGRVAPNELCAPLPLSHTNNEDRAMKIPDSLKYAILFVILSVVGSVILFFPGWFFRP